MQEPRQLYGLGSLVKGIKNAVSGAFKGIKKVAKSPIGKAAMLYFAPMALGQSAGLGGYKSLFANMGNSLFTPKVPDMIGRKGILSQVGSFVGSNKGKIASVAGILAASGLSPPEIELTKQDPEKVKMYSKKYFGNLYPDKSDEEIEELAESTVVEYRAEGGRIGFTKGGDVAKAVEKGISPDEALDMYNEFKKIKAKYGYTMSFNDYLDGEMYATGGRVGLMGGAMPTGIMRANKAGTIERDYRETGGFVPIGIKEKADDVPAMLSKNEFVMTADAVRGMGGGSIEKGAQRLYDQMKTAEKRVV
tara:strand:- start:144 stop:1058 length:915 start_codon:yes stop_codon:yes gene_type:complete